MIGLDAGHDSDAGGELEERSVTLVGFDDGDWTATGPGVEICAR